MKQDEILLEERHITPASSGKRLTRFVPFLLIVLTLGFIGWFLVIFSVAYNFASPGANKLTQDESKYYLDIFTRLPKDFHLFIFFLAFLVSAIGPGDLFLRLFRLNWYGEIERAFYSLAVGLIIFTLVTLGIGVIGLLQLKILLGLLLLAGLTTLWYGWRLYQRQRENWKPAHWREVWRNEGGFTWHRAGKLAVGMALAFYVYITLLGGLNLDTQWDSKWYHLGQAQHFAAGERIYDVVAEEGFTHAALSFYQDMLYTTLYKIGGQVLAKLMHWADAFLTVLFLIYFCRIHFRSTLMGMLAALFFISTPIVSWSSSTAYTDLPLALYGILAVHAFLRWQAGSIIRAYNWLIIIGLMSGYAMGVKFFGIFTLLLLGLGVILFSFWELFRKTGWSSLFRQVMLNGLVVGLSALTVALPWMIRTYFMTGDPIYPAGSPFFHSPYWNEFAQKSVETVFQNPGVERSLWGMLTLPWLAISNSRGFQTVIGPLFLVMLPVCVGVGLLSREHTSWLYRWLGIFVTAWSLLWFVSGLFDTRYTQAIMPVITVLIAFTITKFRWPFGWAGKLAQGCVALVLLIITTLNHPLLTQYQSQFANPLDGAGRINMGFGYLYGQETVYSSQLRWVPAIRFINDNLSAKNDKIYDSANLKRFNMYSYIQLYDATNFDSPAALGIWDIYSPDALQHLKQNKITFVSVYVSDVPYLRLFPIWHNLKQVGLPSDVIDLALFKIDYPPELKG